MEGWKGARDGPGGTLWLWRKQWPNSSGEKGELDPASSRPARVDQDPGRFRARACLLQAWWLGATHADLSPMRRDRLSGRCQFAWFKTTEHPPLWGASHSFYFLFIREKICPKSLLEGEVDSARGFSLLPSKFSFPNSFLLPRFIPADH